MKKINWSWLLLAYFSLFVMGYLDNSRGPAYPLLLKDLNLTPSLGSWFFSIASLSGLLVYLTNKKWLPKLGVVKGTKVSLFIMALGTLGLGFLPKLAPQYPMLLVFSVIFGVGQGLSTFCMNLLVPEATPVKWRSRAFSGLHSCYGIASFLAPLMFSYFQELQYSWSQFFLWMSLLPVIVLLGVFRIDGGIKVNDTKRETSGLSFSRRSLYGGVFSFYVASEIVMSSRLVFFLVEGRSFSNEKASEILSLFFLSLMLGRILFAFLPMQGKSYWAMVVSLILSFACFFFGYYENPWFLGLVGGAMSFYFPMGMDWLTTRFEKGREEMIAACMTQVGVLLILMHIFFGKLASVVGVEKALLMAPVLMVISFVFLIYLRVDNSSGDRPLHQA